MAILGKVLMLGILLFAELLWSSLFGLGALRPPFLAFAAIVLFWNLKMDYRIWLALAVGTLLDLLSPVPFGTYIISLTFAGIATQAWRKIFSHTDSLLSQGIAGALSLVLFYMSALFFSLLLHSFSLDLSDLGGYHNFAAIAGMSLLWSASLPFLFFGLKFMLHKIYRV